MDDHPGRLVDHEEVLVLVRDSQVALLGLEIPFGALGDLHLDELAALEPVALRPAFAVDAHRTGGEEPLGLRTRAHLG
jgi:hypothetical protein